MDDPVLSPLPLTAAQEEVVRRARTEPLTVVCGPPGSGKSHAVVAAALEVVDRGGSVLIATQSPHAADVLADLLGRYPGPDPVLFGDAERRERIATTLSHGAGVAVDLATLHRSWRSGQRRHRGGQRARRRRSATPSRRNGSPRPGRRGNR